MDESPYRFETLNAGAEGKILRVQSGDLSRELLSVTDKGYSVPADLTLAEALDVIHHLVSAVVAYGAKSDHDSDIIELQGVFCPHGDDHRLRSTTYAPPPRPFDAKACIVYFIDCQTCGAFNRVYAQKRWRLRGDDSGRLFRSAEEARAALTGGASADGTLT